jgi:hypothetical protein
LCGELREASRWLARSASNRAPRPRDDGTTVAGVSDRDARFRRLRPDGDLFAHFGIELEPTSMPEPSSSAVAIACARCRWYLRRIESTCPVCGLPVPTP